MAWSMGVSAVPLSELLSVDKVPTGEKQVLGRWEDTPDLIHTTHE